MKGRAVKPTPTAELLAQIKAARLPEPVLEHRFAPPRRWRFDCSWRNTPGTLGAPIALEIEGGIWLPKGRHTTGKGFEADARKYAAAFVLGWRVLRVTPAMIRDGTALEALEKVLR